MLIALRCLDSISHAAARVRESLLLKFVASCRWYGCTALLSPPPHTPTRLCVLSNLVFGMCLFPFPPFVVVVLLFVGDSFCVCFPPVELHSQSDSTAQTHTHTTQPVGMQKGRHDVKGWRLECILSGSNVGRHLKTGESNDVPKRGGAKNTHRLLILP